MKKTGVLFFIIFFNFSHAFSQNATIDIQNNQSLTLENIFDLIKSKTDYQFVYRHDLIKDAPKIKVTKGSIKVKDLLKKGLNTISCTYEFKDNHTIILSQKKPSQNVNKKNARSNNTITIKARVLDKETNQPIAYANIGFIKKSIGTISNENGFFKLEFNESKLSNSEIFQISTLGYQTLKININQLFELISQSNIIYINPKPFALDEVFLTNDKRKEVRLGNTRVNKNTVGYWKDKKALGGEIATKMNVKKKNTKLLDLKFNIVENLSDSLKIRVNVYNYAKRSPSKKILTQNIFYTITQKEGEVAIDLKPYNIRVDDDFVISIELVKVYGESIGFSVSAEDYAGVAFKRYTSQDKWERYNLTGMNFSVLTSVLVKNGKTLPEQETEETNATKITKLKTNNSN